MEKASNRQLKNLRGLLSDKRSRDESGLFAAEGEKIVSDIIARGHKVEEVFVSNSFLGSSAGAALLDRAGSMGAKGYVCADAAFGKVSSLVSSQGVIALVKKKWARSPAGPAENGADLIVVCDGVQDPGNLGSIIRLAAAFSADRVFACGDSADIYNPKTVRASGGAVMEVPVFSCGYDVIRRFKEAGYALFSAVSSSRDSVGLAEITPLPARSMIAFGSEGQGLSSVMIKMSDKCFYIPVSGKVESLNVNSAAAITLFEIDRARRGKNG